MSTRDEDQAPEAAGAPTEAAAEPKRKLELSVEITDVGPCKKRLKVEIAPAEVERQIGESLKSVRKEAAMPGFRPGRAPSTLVQRRYKKEVEGQVKSTLLLAALEQVDEDYKINPISRPDLDLEAIPVPDDGPLTFEMDVEVQPTFELPAYKALTANRPVRTLAEGDVDAQVKLFRERYAQEVPRGEGEAAEPGDLITANLRFDKDGIALNEVKEVKFRLQKELRFQDGRVADLEAALVGARPGDFREAVAQIGSASPDPAIRGQNIRVIFEILDLKTLRLPEVDATFLEGVGFESEAELREVLRGMLQRRLDYQQRQAVRRSILDQLVDQTPFDLPADLVKRQEASTLRNHVLEMRQGGMTDEQIRAREAEIRANAHESTLRSLKEFFLLSKIAEAEGIKVENNDVEDEIEALAARSDESPRRVRARIEKEGLEDMLASQILERKTIDRILEYVKLVDVSLDEEEQTVETLDSSAVPAQPEGEGAAEGQAGGESADAGA
jgi:trigger factor